jgi:hypothetical protein
MVGLIDSFKGGATEQADYAESAWAFQTLKSKA